MKTKRILFTGSGKSASYQIRAVQLGEAIGATVIPRAMHFAGLDAVVVVKRTPADQIAAIHRAGMPLVYDVVDGWPQPPGNEWAKPRCMDWLRAQIKAVRPTAMVAATRAMESDVRAAGFGGPVLTLPHHALPGLRPVYRDLDAAMAKTPTVGYEGAEHYLGRWHDAIQRGCKRRGWVFRVNQPWSETDIAVAVRESGGYAAREWKSNVKLANAQAAGVPIVCNRAAGYLETASGAELWCDNPVDLESCLDEVASVGARRLRGDIMAAKTISLESVAATYREWLEKI